MLLTNTPKATATHARVRFIPRSISTGLIALALLLVNSSNLWGQDDGMPLQPPMASPTANYLEIRDAFQQWSLAHPDEGLEENEGRAAFDRWDWFWGKRAGSATGPAGDIATYEAAMNALATAPLCLDGGLNDLTPWTQLGPVSNIPVNDAVNPQMPDLGIVNDVAVHPSNPNKVYVACRSSGIWVTNNALASTPTWTCITDMLHIPGLGATSIAIAPSDPNVLYANTGAGRGGTSFGSGVIVSMDAGATWDQASPVTPGAGVSAGDIAIHPTNPLIVYAAINTALYKTTDGGATWNMVLDIELSDGPTVGDIPNNVNQPARFIHHVILSPSDPDNTVYCSADGNKDAIDAGHDDGAIMRVSHDGGLTWALMDPLGIIVGWNCTGLSIATTAAEPSSLWAAFSGPSVPVQYWKSTDQGTTWNQVVSTGLDGCGNNIAISPTSTLYQYCSDGMNFKHFIDELQYWSLPSLPQTEHVDCRVVRVINYAGNDLVFEGHDGGVSISQDHGVNWTNINGNGLGIREIYGIGVNELTHAIATGQQDNAVSVYQDGSWSQPNVFQDGGLVVASRKYPNRIYAEKWCCQGSSSDNLLALIKNTATGTWEFDSSNPFQYGPQGPSTPFRPIGKSDDDHILIGTLNLFRSDESAVSPYLDFQPISAFDVNYSPLPDAWRMRCFASAPSNTSVIYACLSGQTWGNSDAEKFFFKTTIGGGTGPNDWTNITTSLPQDVIDWFSINAIVVDPNDPDRLWIGCGGYSANEYSSIPAPYNGDRRVYESEDGGQTWTDQSTGLPGLAINDMVYQRGSDDAIYVATDVGVFYRDHNMWQWECFNTGMPTMIVNDLDVDYCSRTLYAGAQGRGLWSVPLYDAPRKERVISVDQTWSGQQLLAGNLRVLSDHKLTITGTVKCYEGVRIIVEPNAQLIVDGGTITSTCGQFWTGIEVWGNTAQHQFGLPYAQYQGTLVLKNGALIENARNAFTNWKPDDWSSMGGVIIASDATFRNCRRSAEFMSYRNFQPPSPNLTVNNRSSFARCTFEVNDDYPGGDDFDAHVTMWEVDGITFSQCDLINTQSTGPGHITESNKLGEGILAADASFSVFGKCTVVPPLGQPCPEGYTIPSTFTGLDHGVHVVNTGGGIHSFTLDHCDFTNNICAAYASGVIGCKVTNCNITLGDRDVTLSGDEDENFHLMHRGIFTTESYDLLVDDNDLSQAPAGVNPVETEGIVIGYSRDHNDMVFRNHATGLTNAYVGEGICVDVNNKPAVGLTFMCNENTNDEYDFWNRKVDDPTPGTFPEDQTIRTVQGTKWRPADNTFDRDDDLPLFSDFNTNSNLNQVTYLFKDVWTPFEPHDIHAPYIYPFEVLHRLDNNCQSRLMHRVPPLGPVGFTELHAVLQEEKLAYGNTRYLYDQLIDGGSTDQTVQEIEESWPEDAWDLRAYLLDRSPYLSVEVLEDMVNQDILPDAMVAEICIANPEATSTDGFTDWLEFRAPHPLPSYLIDQIIASWDTKTYRFTLEEDMAQHHQDMTQAANLWLDHFQSDTAYAPVDSLRMVWRQVRTSAARYAEALTWIQQQQYDSAKTAVDEIPVDDPKLQAPQLAEKDRMLDLIAFFHDMHNTGKNAAQLAQGDIDRLEGIIDGKYDRPATWAQNLLCFHYGICRPPLTGGEGGPEQRMIHVQDKEQNTDTGPYLHVKPNPAKNWLVFEYQLNGPVANAFIRVVDLNGHELVQLPITMAMGEPVWDLRGMAKGSYMAELVNGDKPVISSKFIVQ